MSKITALAGFERITANRKLLVDHLRRKRGASQQVEAVENVGEVGAGGGEQVSQLSDAALDDDGGGVLGGLSR